MRKINQQIENTNKEIDINKLNRNERETGSSARTCVGTAKLKHGAAFYFKTILLTSYRNSNRNNLGTKGT